MMRRPPQSRAMTLAMLAMALGAGRMGSLPAVRVAEDRGEPLPITEADRQRLERAAEKRRRKAEKLAARGHL